MNKTNKRTLVHITLISLFGVLLLVSLAFLSFVYYYNDKILPNTYIGRIYVGDKTIEEAKILVKEKTTYPDSLTIHLGSQTNELSLTEIELQYDIEKSIDESFAAHRRRNASEYISMAISSLSQPNIIPLSYSYNKQKLYEYFEVVTDKNENTPQYPYAQITNDGVVVYKGLPGIEADIAKSLEAVEDHLSNTTFTPIQLPTKVVDIVLSEPEVLAFKNRIENIRNKSILITHEYTTFTLKSDMLINLVDAKGMIRQDKYTELLTKDLAPKFERTPQNALFKAENGKVTQFMPAKEGVVIEYNSLYSELINALTFLETNTDKETTVALPVKTSSPTISTDQVNELGIKELIGRGTSTFKGSIPGRVHNVAHASTKINGILIAPGETFSFNNAVGDVSVLTGYKQAYVIKDGKTVLGDGGGLCQVSTTLFRAALNAGLPINERRAHSYRVGYYEQDTGPGLDATVYSPTTDFKFTNDTPSHILIQTTVDTKAMTAVFELYGTSDGRKATITKPVTTSVTAPPEDLYVDDPTIPTGKVTQVEHKAWGAKVVFDYTVERNGQEIYKKTFVSSYRPWQAVFMRGTGPV